MIKDLFSIGLMVNKSFNKNIIDLKFSYLGKITQIKEDSDIIVWIGFKLVNYWEIKQYSGKKILFWEDDTLNKKSNLLNRLLNNDDYINLPYNKENYSKLKNLINFKQDFFYSDFKTFIETINQESKEMILLDSSVTIKYKNLINQLGKLNLNVFSYNHYKDFIKFPYFLNIPEIISIFNKNKIYYIGKEINTKNHNLEYYFTDVDKVSSNFLDVSIDKVPRHYLYRKLQPPKPTTNIKIDKLEIKPIIPNKKYIVSTIEEKTKIIPLRDIKMFLQKVNNKEYPDKNQINKILFLIDDLPILRKDGGDFVEYLVNIMVNLTYKYIIYYNGILLNNKLTDNGGLNFNKIRDEFMSKEKSGKFLHQKIFKIDKNEYDLIFYNLTNPELVSIYQKLPYPKILNSMIIPYLWKDDRNIISLPSKLFLEVISSGIIKNQNNKIIKKPERFFIMEPFLPPLNNNKSLKEEYLADIIIGIVCKTDEEKVEINLLKQIIENYRNKYNKDIYLVLYHSKLQLNESWIDNTTSNNFNGLDLVIFLDDSLTNIYQIDNLILENVSLENPLFLSKSKIYEDYLGVNYSGFYPQINDDIGKIIDFKKYFSEKLEKVILGNTLNEKNKMKLLKYSWNNNSFKKYDTQFSDIISFLNSKNYRRNTKLLNLFNQDEGFNFYYHETISNNNLSQIYQNVEDFFDKIKEFKNILLISSDYPGYGGASSLNNELSKILRLKGHNCKELYYLFNKQENKSDIILQFMQNYFEENTFFNKDNIRITDENNLIRDLEKMEFKPDLIILKNHLNGKRLPDKFNNVYFLVAGIFKNELNKFFYDLNEDETKKFVNHQVINLLKNPKIKGISNSYHTKKILKDSFDIDTELYYVNFIPKYPQKLPEFNHEKRPYKYGIICSNFNRPIKNLENIIKDVINNLDKNQKVLLIGKNSNKYNHDNFDTIDLVPSFLMDDYLKKIQNVIINSYYESCSNLSIQAKFQGCNVIRQPFNNIENSIKILITSTQYPYYGGSATNAYKLINYLKNNNFKVAGIFYHPKKIDDNKLDPLNIGNIYQLRDDVISKNFKDEKEVNNIKQLVCNDFEGYPDLIFSFNYYTPILSKILFPYCNNFYFIVGNPTLTIGKDSIIKKDISIQKFLQETEEWDYDENTFNLEKESFEKSEGVIIDQGHLNIETISKVFPDKKYLFNDYFNYGINILMKDLDDLELNSIKEYDLIAISSNWDRTVKNPRFLYNILKEYPQYRKIVIGKKSNIYDHLPNVISLDLLPYQEMLKYLGKSKLLLVPSYSESGSNTIIEALKSDCQVLTSKNVGYHYLLKDHQLCKDVYDIDEWKNKINFLLNNKLPIQKFNMEDYHYKFLNFINNYKINRTPRVLVVCGDKPYYGGAATNSYNIIKTLRKENIKVTGLFISYQKEGLDDPENIGQVYHIFLDDSIKIRLQSWKIENNYDDFDIIFCKNYKVFTLIKKLYPNIPIIYSPSGLRQITAEISRRKKYYQYLKNMDITLVNKDIKLEDDSNWFNLIMKNDRYLENYVLEKADYLLPNSKITWEIITYNYPEYSKKLLNPTYLTNINFINKTNFNFSKRRYHFGFIATNWKRATKNLDLVKQIINNPKMKEFKFLIIGMNHKIKKSENVTVLNHVEHFRLIKELRLIKTVVITSYYDSNPNVLIEAIESGCNVVSSLNVGNAENLRKELIVEQPEKINNWINILLKSITKSYPFLGSSSENVSRELIKIINYYSNQMDSVGIYKVNSHWDTTDKIKINPDFDCQWLDNINEDFEEHQGRRTNILGNIYLCMYQKITEKLGFNHNHFIFVDETVETCLRFKWKNLTIWILKNKEEVLSFNRAKFYFVRGHYPHFYNKLINDNAYAILYPATSLKYQYNISRGQKIIKRDLEKTYNFRQVNLYKKFKMVLIHEDETYQKQYLHNKKLLLEKFSLGDDFKLLDKFKERKYDIIMVAQALQKSKNHQIMFDFIKYCDTKNINIKIAYVSNKEILKKTYSNFYDSEIVDFYSDLKPSELCQLYNNSKVNLILSNRDCVPRVIPESLNCGCYNITTDLLSDGKFYYDGIFGELISLDFAEVEMLESGNISYVSNPLLFKILLKKIKKEYDHNRISEEFKKKYNLEKMVYQIVNNI